MNSNPTVPSVCDTVIARASSREATTHPNAAALTALLLLTPWPMEKHTNLIRALATTAVAFAVLQAIPAAQAPPRYAITEARLADAFAEVREERAPFIGDVVAMRQRRGDPARPEWEALFLSREYPLKREVSRVPPFAVYVASPYMRALATAYEARRRYASPPPLSAAALNIEGVLVSVTPSEDFIAADAIEDVVLKRFNGEVIHAVRQDVQPTTLQNRGGASRDLAAGAFYFRLEDFEQLPVTVVCISRLGNYEIAIGFDDVRF